MLFIDLVNAVLIKLRQDPITSLSTDTTTKAYMAQLAVNRAIARVWNFKPWAFKSRSLLISQSNATVSLDPRIGEIFSIRSSLSPFVIKVVSRHVFDTYVDTVSDRGNPVVMTLEQNAGYTSNPGVTGTLLVTSSSASDTTQKVLIKGLVGGLEDYEEVSLNGTANIVTTKSFSSIESITKSDKTVGIVSVAAAGDGTAVLSLAPADKTVRKLNVRFFPQPSETLTITFFYFRLPPNLTTAYEDSLIPDRWTYVVEQWAYALALQTQGQDQLSEFTTQEQLAIKMLEEDMSSEEVLTISEPMISLKAGDAGASDMWPLPPSGTGYIQGF